MLEFITALYNLLAEMSPYLLLGFLFAGILHVAVPATLYRRYLSRNTFGPVFYAALFGVPLPLCSCGVIPTAMSLRKEGASKGAVTSFLIATPQTGIDSILATYSLLGLPFALIRPIVALITGITGGALVNRAERKAASVQNLSEGKLQSPVSSPSRFQKSAIIEMLRYGFVDMLQDIGRWLIIGLLIAAIITVALPADFFVQFAESPLLSMLIVLAASIPMYLCATGSIPIAAALMLKGLSPGAALVLLMAGPATNIASLLVIDRVLGRRTMFIYLLTIIAGAIGFGLVIDNFLPLQWFVVSSTGGALCHTASLPLWKTLSGILLLLLIVNAFVLKYYKSHKIKKEMNNQTTYRVGGMSCNHCKANVENNLKKLSGVTNAVVDLPSGTVTVEGTASEQEIQKSIEELGYNFGGKR